MGKGSAYTGSHETNGTEEKKHISLQKLKNRLIEFYFDMN